MEEESILKLLSDEVIIIREFIDLKNMTLKKKKLKWIFYE